MHPTLRKSVFTKGAALGFSGNLLLGNFWLAFNIAGGESPPWLSKAMFFSTAVVVISGIGMAFVYAQILMSGDQGLDEQEAQEPGANADDERPGDGE